MDYILDLIKQAFAWLKNIAQRIIRGIISFTQHIKGWFKSLNLVKSRHHPFIGNAKKTQLKEMIKNAPIKNVGIFDTNDQIFKGVYDNETDEIIHAELLGADQLDAQTKSILGNEAIVVLN